MKRGMLILLFTLLLACSVRAMVVELSATPATFTDAVPSSLTCTATISADENLTRLSLYYENNQSLLNGWAEREFDTDMQSGGTKIFSVSGLENATYTWNCLALSNDSIETWAGLNNTFAITFTEAATEEPTPPVCTVTADTNKTTNEDTDVDIDSDMDASGGIYCTDDDDITYTVQTQSGVGTFSITGNNISAYPDANATGEGYATIKADDGNGGITYVDVNVTWTSVNDAPYLSKIIPNQTWIQDTTKSIDLEDYFSDTDGDSLNYSYAFTSSSPDINLTIDSDGDVVFTPEDDWTGTETLTFTAMDPSNASVTSNEVTLTVEASNTTGTNTAPSIDTVDPETDPTISVGESQTFKITASDADGDDLNYTWRVDGLLQEEETSTSFVYTAKTIGEYVIKVAVSDGTASAKYTWALTVKSATSGTNKTASPSDEETEEDTSVCGDGVCDDTETSTSCCKDCGCPEGWQCKLKDDEYACTREKGSGNIILLAIIITLFVGGAAGGVYFYKKKQEKEIFGGLANTPFAAPPKEAVKEVTPQKPAVAVKKPSVSFPKKPAAVQKPVVKTHKTTSQVLLKKYITYNLKKGKSFEQIKKELLKVGWTGEQIDDAYTAARLDEAFS